MSETAILSFRDKHGRLWCPKVTARNIKDLEIKSGIGMFDALFGLLKEQKNRKDLSDEDYLLDTVRVMFGSVWHLMYLVYEACKDEKGQSVFQVSSEQTGEYTINKNAVTFDEFCESIEKAQFMLAINVAISAIHDFFPKPEKGDEPAKEDKKNPPDSGRGATS